MAPGASKHPIRLVHGNNIGVRVGASMNELHHFIHDAGDSQATAGLP
jgi:hypothetical protein